MGIYSIRKNCGITCLSMVLVTGVISNPQEHGSANQQNLIYPGSFEYKPQSGSYAVPILIADVSDLAINSVLLTLVYPSDLLSLREASLTEGLSEKWIHASRVYSGRHHQDTLRVAILSKSTLKRQGQLLDLDFEALTDSVSNNLVRIYSLTMSGRKTVIERQAGVEDEPQDFGNNLPTEFSLQQNYPNPFNPTTVIKFQIAEFGFVSLKVYNLLGREVETLISEKMSPGNYEAKWDGTDRQGKRVASGMYIYRMDAEGYVRSRKMMLLR